MIHNLECADTDTYLLMNKKLKEKLIELQTKLYNSEELTISYKPSDPYPDITMLESVIWYLIEQYEHSSK